MKPGLDYIGVSVFALIFNNKNEIILINHTLSEKKPKEFSDCWSMPGGQVEFGETNVEALRREIKEEIDMEIYDEELINVDNWITKDRHWVGLNYKAKSKDLFNNLEPEKIQDVKFFALNKIPKNMSKLAKECIEIVKKSRTAD